MQREETLSADNSSSELMASHQRVAVPAIMQFDEIGLGLEGDTDADEEEEEEGGKVAHEGNSVSTSAATPGVNATTTESHRNTPARRFPAVRSTSSLNGSHSSGHGLTGFTSHPTSLTRAPSPSPPSNRRIQVTGSGDAGSGKRRGVSLLGPVVGSVVSDAGSSYRNNLNLGGGSSDDLSSELTALVETSSQRSPHTQGDLLVSTSVAAAGGDPDPSVLVMVAGGVTPTNREMHRVSSLLSAAVVKENPPLVDGGDGRQEDFSTPQKPTVGAEADSAEDVEEETCPICLDEFSADNPASPNACGHNFHLSCLLSWQQRSNSCPMCMSVNGGDPEPDIRDMNFDTSSNEDEDGAATAAGDGVGRGRQRTSQRSRRLPTSAAAAAAGQQQGSRLTDEQLMNLMAMLMGQQHPATGGGGGEGGATTTNTSGTTGAALPTRQPPRPQPYHISGIPAGFPGGIGGPPLPSSMTTVPGVDGRGDDTEERSPSRLTRPLHRGNRGPVNHRRHRHHGRDQVEVVELERQSSGGSVRSAGATGVSVGPVSPQIRSVVDDDSGDAGGRPGQTPPPKPSFWSRLCGCCRK